jgi:predicted TIM-barrel fold metal-dependent hydrolase
MDRDRVQAHVLYGGLNAAFQMEDQDLNAVFIRAYNEWTSEFCSAAPDRLLGLGFLPINDVEAAVEELYNCARLGLKGVQFQAFDAKKRLFDVVWDPLWSAAEETGLPVHFHVGGGQWSTKGEKPPGRGVQTASTTVAPIQLDEVLAEVVLSGMLHDHPKLKAVLGESSIGWIPFVLHRMDWEYDVRINKGRGGDAPALDMKPSDYYRRQMYATFQTDPIGAKLLEYVGVENAMWASDYPHGDSVWPYSHETVEQDFAGVDEASLRKVTHDNAQKLYLT